MKIRIVRPHPPEGPRVIVSLGRGEVSLTVSEATDLHDAIGDALLIVAKRHGEVDPRCASMFFIGED